MTLRQRAIARRVPTLPSLLVSQPGASLETQEITGALRALELGLSGAERHAVKALWTHRKNLDGLQQPSADLMRGLVERWLGAQFTPETLHAKYCEWAASFSLRAKLEEMDATALYQDALMAVETDFLGSIIVAKKQPSVEEVRGQALAGVYRPLITQLHDQLVADHDDLRSLVFEWTSSSLLFHLFDVWPSEMIELDGWHLRAALRQVDFAGAPISMPNLMLGDFGADLISRCIRDPLPRLSMLLAEPKARKPWTKAMMRKFQSRVKRAYRRQLKSEAWIKRQSTLA
jgi:hypothetical protein